MAKKCIGYNDITKKFIYLDDETGLTSEGNGVLAHDKIEEIKHTFGLDGTGSLFKKSKMCECCRVEFLMRDMIGDLCCNCHDFIEEHEQSKIIETKTNLVKKITEFVNNKSVYTQEYGDVIYSMELIRELDKLVGKEEPNQAKGE